MKFKVYAASAGSGKTYSMVRDMLVFLMEEKQAFASRFIWAVTFTNKAANEMKERLLHELENLARGDETPMLNDLIGRTGFAEKQIRRKAKQRLEEILFGYDALSISTIDKFSFRIIKRFARELGISPGINVDMDDHATVDALTDDFFRELHEQSPYLPALEEMVLENLDEAKKWTVSKELKSFKNYLLPDHYKTYAEALIQTPLDNIFALRKKYSNLRHKARQEMIDTARELLGFLHNSFSQDISRLEDKKNILNKIREGNFGEISKRKSLLNLLTGEKLWKKNKENPEAEHRIKTLTEKIYRNYLKMLQADAVLKAVNPLLLMQEMSRRIEEYKRENDIIFISDFNKIIHGVVQTSPTPFIYMRLGEKYSQYFIDEFQDTSQIQWNNMIPLISEVFSGHFPQGSAAIFGDAKQSIYQFRGGEPEQFIRLTLPDGEVESSNPFPVKKDIISLDGNWRSAPEIVDFNNRIFPVMSGQVNTGAYQVPYQPGYLVQKPQKKHAGYVRLDFRAVETEEEYLDRIAHTVSEILQSTSFKPGDISILFRKNDEGRKISEVLTKAGYSVVSVDSLSLENAPELKFLNAFFEYRLHPSHAVLFDLLTAYAEWKNIQPDSLFYKEFIPDKNKILPFMEVLEKLSGKKIDENIITQNIYDFFVSLIHYFNMHIPGGNAYLRAFLSEVARIMKDTVSDEMYLERWKTHISKKSVSSLDSEDSIKLMTVHKSKGLEFPVVIYAYPENKDILDKDEKKFIWFEMENEEIPFLPIQLQALKKYVKLREQTGGFIKFNDFANRAIKKYEEETAKIRFEKLNLQYVAFTRASHALFYMPYIKKRNTNYQYVFPEMIKNSVENFETFKKTDENIMESGDLKSLDKTGAIRREVQMRETGDIFKPGPFQTELIRVNQDKTEYWSEKKKERVSYGRLVHRYLSGLYHEEDVHRVESTIRHENDEVTAEKIVLLIKQMLANEKIRSYFKKGLKVITERPVMLQTEQDLETYRPDRLVFHTDKKLSIIDFKTGEERTEHKRQIQRYASMLSDAGFEIMEKLLIYINEEKITYRVVE